MGIDQLGKILNNFKAGLQQSDEKEQNSIETKESESKNVSNQKNAVETNSDDNAGSKSLFNEIRREYSPKNSVLKDTEQEYLDALEALEKDSDNEYKFNDSTKQFEKNGLNISMIKDYKDNTSEKDFNTDKAVNMTPVIEYSKSVFNDKLKKLGATGELETTINADGTYSAVEKGDGFEVSYTFDKKGNITSYTNAIGTFTAQDDSVVLTPNDTGKNDLLKWSRELKGNSYTIQNTKVEDIISAIKSSGPDAEKVINVALNLYDPNNPRHNKSGSSCVNYTNDVEKEFGVDIGGTTSAEVKENGKEISYEDTKTGDILNRDRHIGIVLLKIDVEAVNKRTGKLEKNPLIITADNGAGIDITIRDGRDDSLNIEKIRFFKGASGNDV